MNPHNVLVKVYGNLYPADEALLQAVHEVCGEAVELEGDLLRWSFEGIWFPLDEVLDAVRPRLAPDCRGKLDYLDLENWTLTRHVFSGMEVAAHSASLNNVLDYLGY